ncbi:hypothetical protein UFOVP156_4 [uncultured Caudovirales phage]|uniref:Uncharacterized protein n=1 Tax=uncultured Caudovirales phage TaxID=2100421 RepID=A0A6J7WG30_9CAUD|nr:hypothetical protein UFOVP156_4 [uncultured Caudovirales phage]
MTLTISERLALAHTLAKFPENTSYDDIHSLIYCGDYLNDENPVIVAWTPYENMTSADLIQAQDDLVWALDKMIISILSDDVMQPLERLATETADWIPAQASMSPTLFTDAAAAYRKLAAIRSTMKINLGLYL